jgi:hypothetical protein
VAVPASQGVVKASGTPVAMTGEATNLVAGKTYQVTNAAKRILDPATALAVRDNGVVQTANVLAVDFLFGLVTFAAGYTVTGPVTLDGAYLPTLDVAQVRGVSVRVECTLQDATVMPAAAVSRQLTLLDVSGSVERLELSGADLDPGVGGVQSLDAWLRTGTPKVLEWLITAGYRVRAWVLFGQQEVQGQVDGLVATNLSFEGAPPAAPATSYTAVMAYSTGA